MKHKTTIVFDDKKDAISAGFRIHWVSGEDENSEVEMSCGAGCGSPFIVFSRKDKKTGKTRYAVADIRPVVNAMAAALA